MCVLLQYMARVLYLEIATAMPTGVETNAQSVC